MRDNVVAIKQGANLLNSNTLYGMRHKVLKHKYETGFNRSEQLALLFGANDKRRTFAENRTCMRVEQCHNKLGEIIDQYFTLKEKQLSELVTKVRRRQSFVNVSYQDFISHEDLQQVEAVASKLIKKAVTQRFNKTISFNCKLEIDPKVNQLFAINEPWLCHKTETIELTRTISKLNGMAWGQVTEAVVANKNIAAILDKTDLSIRPLKQAGISVSLEEDELTKEIRQQLLGILTVIKMDILTSLRHQSSKVLYEMHDQLVDVGLSNRSDRVNHRLAIVNKQQLYRA